MDVPFSLILRRPSAILAESNPCLVILNAQDTPFDRAADAVLRGSIGEVLPKIVEMV